MKIRRDVKNIWRVGMKGPKLLSCQYSVKKGSASRPFLFAEQILSHGFTRINTDKAFFLDPCESVKIRG
jgi:hypothetical protein